DTKWKHEKRNQQWYLGETFNAAIGQGYVAATPMQMAQLMSVVANGGLIYRPVMVKAEAPLQPVASADIKPQIFYLIRDSLYGVVNEPNGTGQRAKSALTVIGGKTGTSQVVGKKKGLTGERFMDHAWFVAFAPVEKPAIALSVFVEHGGGGGAVAAPIAKLAIEAYLKSEKLKTEN
ncbi:MAG: penicillin-binding transpeptidase domain-containing protein, partial [Thermodesulfovibrionales bacterium]|nr:penicillin-binding transpeptidase domain-containing protein [Thermodesulfovibrionales bacterium]